MKKLFPQKELRKALRKWVKFILGWELGKKIYYAESPSTDAEFLRCSYMDFHIYVLGVVRVCIWAHVWGTQLSLFPPTKGNIYKLF